MALPGLAADIFPYLPILVGSLLFVSAYRIGPVAAFGSLNALPETLRLVLIYQLVAPLVALAVVFALGLADTAPGLALVLVLAGPSVAGSSNLAILLGKEPASAMRLMIMGTALFPLTVIPVLWALPAFPTLGTVLMAALKLMAFVSVTAALAFALRGRRDLTGRNLQALDGGASLILAIAVIGLMAAVGPTLVTDPLLLILWLLFALGLNFGAQAIAFKLSFEKRVGPSIIAGNRNIALFLVALPPDVVAQILIFIGVYQIPMYLTPIAMQRLYRSGT